MFGIYILYVVLNYALFHDNLVKFLFQITLSLADNVKNTEISPNCLVWKFCEKGTVFTEFLVTHLKL